MEENVALDSSKQKQFLNSIKGLKKLIKKNNAESKPNNFVSRKRRNTDSHIKKRKRRGLVYLSHIPHGFYEHEMTQYFKQFGSVTNVRVIRSKRTGRSKGCAFVEFKQTSVAQIVAETMNNYLMGKRLIKAVYIPPEKQRPNARRKNWNTVNNPGINLKKRLKKAFNENKDESGELKRARKLLSNLSRTKKKLSALGIDYDFFMPVDIPDVLKNEKVIKQEKSENQEKQDVKEKKEKKVKVEADIKTVKKETAQNKKVDQKTKEVKLKEAGGVKPAESFIKIEEDSGDESDSTLGFDSDEYEKMLENESDDDENESDDADEGSSDDDLSEDEDDTDNESNSTPVPLVQKIPLKKNKGKSVPVQGKKIKNQEPAKVQQNKRINKRKATQKSAVATKKPKFEKQEKNTNQQFKKKK